MPRWFGTIIGLAFLVLASASWAGPQVPVLTGRVMDLANILSGVQKRDLTDQLAKVQARTGVQMVLVSLPHLGRDSIETWGLTLGRTWKIGRGGKDDGIVIVLAPNDRQVRIEVGYGLEDKITDAVASHIIQAYMLPAARKGRYAEGLTATIDGLTKVIVQPNALSFLDLSLDTELTVGLIVLLGGFVVIFVVVIAYVSTFRTRAAYPPLQDERTTSVFDDNQGVYQTLQAGSRDIRRDSLADDWRSPSEERGFSGMGGSFGGGGATGKW